MKKYLLIIFILNAVHSFAQIPEDALKYSYFPQNGSARNVAIGGAMGSLGGDITAIFVNPAGLGNYKTGEFVFTPGFSFNNNKTNFRDALEKSKKNNFSIGTIGAVYGSVSKYKPTISEAFSIAFTQTANFNNTVHYKGVNNFSSRSEQFAEEFAKSGYTIDEVLNSNSPIPYTVAPALYTYLIDTFTIDGTTKVKGLPEFVIENGGALMQENTVATRGGLYELALGGAINKKDKLLFGATLGIPIMSYKNNTTFRESDTSSNTSNGFGYFSYTDRYETVGAGINLKLGLIYRPKEYIRLGLAVHTPSFMFSLMDKHSTTIETDTENYEGYYTETSNTFTNGKPGESRYTMLTPWKAMISGSYVFREMQDVRKQKAFITADIEYVNHRGSKFYSAAENPSVDETDYYKALSSVIKQQYKGNFNFRLGGEVKFTTIMARLGFAYYSNPYKDAALKSHKMLVSGGLGYRNKGFFIDLTYAHAFNKETNFPYRLQDKANTYATVKNQRGNIVASIGFKF
ncbi:OmpP1/FadL family transporter [Ferruginibacter sp. SUN002]|uniref:OmpP1/FadL family transporter n=1 Tax=Ferruginibacter sp. SUN002 TaxID=2937789 RepID=UPI003D36D1DB